jgi:hypothetical protein
MLEAGRLEVIEALEAIGVDRCAGCDIFPHELASVFFWKSGITVMRVRPDARPRFSTATMTRAAFRPLSWRLPRRPACVPPTQVSSGSTSPRSGPLAVLIIARRNLWSIIHAVSYRFSQTWFCSSSAEIVSRHQVRGPKPHDQRDPAVVKDCSR